MNKKKIINDPIYGFITIPNDLIFDCISHPYFQRLRRIRQLGLSHLVYPGAQHTRFQHALGAMHLMSKAIESLRSKNVEITSKEEQAVLAAILLHDIGHGPFSHSLESSILPGVAHELISLSLMQELNTVFNGQLELAISIFKGDYPKNFLHQLVSGQLDMDRLDYLRRDSFYTGVSEGTIGIERIIQMLNVHEDQLVIDQKGVYSIEKFIMARRFMYWQVYLHKTSLAADQVLTAILKRAKELINNGKNLFASPAFEYFLKQNIGADQLKNNKEVLVQFNLLDDTDIFNAIKTWQASDDDVLSRLCSMLVNRTLPKIKIMNTPASEEEIHAEVERVKHKWGLSERDSKYFVFAGDLANNTYSSESEQIRILYKDGRICDISEASETYSFTGEEKPTVKYFISYPK
ncbi:MAG: HD domain-containing protein [Bacteroidia bacterium]